MATIINSRYGACLVSKNIYDGKGKLKWCIHETSKRDVDNGWRFLSDIDTEEYLNSVNNWCILAYESVIEIEPAVLAIYDMPVGTEVTLMHEGKKKFFIDTNTGEEITLYKDHF
jgi:hypothetical protein